MAHLQLEVVIQWSGTSMQPTIHSVHVTSQEQSVSWHVSLDSHTVLGTVLVKAVSCALNSYIRTPAGQAAVLEGLNSAVHAGITQTALLKLAALTKPFRS